MKEVQTYYITEGNTVRSVAQPLPDRKQRERERREEIERNRRIQQRKHARMMRKQRFYALCTAIVVVASCALFVGYVNLTNSITTHMNNVSMLQEQITEIKADNSAASSRIATSTNLAEVKNRAAGELGMVYANADQIVYYSMDDNDFMSQYHSIP